MDNKHDDYYKSIRFNSVLISYILRMCLNKYKLNAMQNNILNKIIKQGIKMQFYNIS